MPGIIKINSNGRFRREHVESCPSTTKNISTTTKPMATKLGRMMTYHERLPFKKSHYPLITRQFKMVISAGPEYLWSSNMVR